MPNNHWSNAWQRTQADREKEAEATEFDAWRESVPRLDESVDAEESYEQPHPRRYERSVSAQTYRSKNRSHPRWDEGEEDYNDEPWAPSPEAEMRRFFLWRWLSKFIPAGYGTYAAVAAWIVINIFAALGYQIPGFDVIEGNEGAGINLGLALAYLRRALG
jgi:hypothetical protein